MIEIPITLKLDPIVVNRVEVPDRVVIVVPVQQVVRITVVPVRLVLRITVALVQQVVRIAVVPVRLVLRIAVVPVRLDRRGMLLHPVRPVHVLSS
jgi:hypothetical protein